MEGIRWCAINTEGEARREELKELYRGWLRKVIHCRYRGEYLEERA